MSEKTVHNPALHLSDATRMAIESLGISLHDYSCNIEDSLRMRGAHKLAEKMLAEIRESIDEFCEDSSLQPRLRKRYGYAE